MPPDRRRGAGQGGHTTATTVGAVESCWLGEVLSSKIGTPVRRQGKRQNAGRERPGTLGQLGWRSTSASTDEPALPVLHSLPSIPLDCFRYTFGRAHPECGGCSRPHLSLAGMWQSLSLAAGMQRLLHVAGEREGWDAESIGQARYRQCCGPAASTAIPPPGGRAHRPATLPAPAPLLCSLQANAVHALPAAVCRRRRAGRGHLEWVQAVS